MVDPILGHRVEQDLAGQEDGLMRLAFRHDGARGRSEGVQSHQRLAAVHQRAGARPGGLDRKASQMLAQPRPRQCTCSVLPGWSTGFSLRDAPPRTSPRCRPMRARERLDDRAALAEGADREHDGVVGPVHRQRR